MEDIFNGVVQKMEKIRQLRYYTTEALLLSEIESMGTTYWACMIALSSQDL